MEFPVFSREITLDKMRAYTGLTARNTHTDEDIGKSYGFRGAIAQGSHLGSILNEFMIRSFGQDFLYGGRIAINFIRMVRPGDVVTPRAKIVKSEPADDGRAEVDLEVWLENQNGEVTTAGTASVVSSSKWLSSKT